MPWDITDEDIVAEIATHRLVAEFKNHPLRAQPENWTEAHWRNTYGFPTVAAGYDKEKGNHGMRLKFMNPPSSKDGFKVEDCASERERRMLRFLVPILNPDKPTTLPLKLLKAIYGAYTGKRMCVWGHILQEVLSREVPKIGGKKGCPLFPFIYHLYFRFGILTTREKEDWRTRQELPPTPPLPTPEEMAPGAGEGVQDEGAATTFDWDEEPELRGQGKKRKARDSTGGAGSSQQKKKGKLRRLTPVSPATTPVVKETRVTLEEEDPDKQPSEVSRDEFTDATTEGD